MSGRQLRRREFMDEVKRTCLAALAWDQTEIHTRSTMNLLKIHFTANYRIHYEVMISASDGLIELGLHFEDGPESTTQLLAYFDRFILEIKHELGAHFELERWTKSWGHCFEVWPLEPLTATFAGKLGRRLAEIIDTLEPILAEAVQLGIASEMPRPSSGRPRFRRRT